MQVRKIFLFPLSALLFLCLGSLQAQQVVTNENGEKVIVYPDGSWRYYEEDAAQDSIPLSPVAQSIQAEQEQLEADLPKKKKKRKKQKSSNSSGKKKGKKSKNASVVNGLDAQLLREANVQAGIAQEEVNRLEEEIKDLSFNRIFLEKELEDANTSGEATLDDLLIIEQRLKAARKEENKTKGALSEAKKGVKQWNRIIGMSPAKRQKAMADFVDVVDNTPSTTQTEELPSAINRPGYPAGDQAMASSANDINNNSSPDTPKRQKRKLKAYNKSNDVLYNPPKLKNCEFTFDGRDEFSGKKRRELAPQLFFTYTSDQLRPYFKNREYISCYAHLTALSGGLKYLTLEFTISSPNAQREFGLLEKGSPISIKFLDGTTIKLINTKTDMGRLDPVNKTVRYQGQYSINSGAEKFLKKNEVDLVRVVWSQGYEDYEVYYMDFIADQFRCLE